jgi:hypothetical protein
MKRAKFEHPVLRRLIKVDGPVCVTAGATGSQDRLESLPAAYARGDISHPEDCGGRDFSQFTVGDSYCNCPCQCECQCPCVCVCKFECPCECLCVCLCLCQCPTRSKGIEFSGSDNKNGAMTCPDGSGVYDSAHLCNTVDCDSASPTLKAGVRLREEERYGLVWDRETFGEYVANAPAFDVLRAIEAGVPLSQALPAILSTYSDVPANGEALLQSSIRFFAYAGLVVLQK